LDLVTAAKVITGHLVLATIAILVAVATVGVVYLKVPTTYSGNAIVLLLSPITGGLSVPAPEKGPRPAPLPVRNPYLVSADQSLFVLAQVISTDLTSDQTKALLERDGQKANYLVSVRSDQPAIVIAVTDHDRNRIVERLNDLIAIAQTDLTQRQLAAGVPKDTWATSNVSSVPLSMTKTKSKLTTLIIAAALGLGAAISLVFITESIQAGSRRRERSRLLETLHELERQRELGMAEQPAEVPRYG
jgi:hypothetical protein